MEELQQDQEETTSPPVEESTDAPVSDESQREDSDTPDDAGADTPKPRGVQKRIDELVKQREEWKRQSDYWREQADMVTRQKQEQQTPVQRPEPATKKPEPSQFETYDAYVESLAEWKTEQRLAEREAQYHQIEQQKAVEIAQAKLQEKVSVARTKYDDFDEVAFDSTVPINRYMRDAMLDSDHGAEIAYYLGKHKPEAERISKMNPVAAIREIGRLESKVEAGTLETKRTPGAPPPINPVGGSGDHIYKDPDKLPIDEWMRLEKAGKLRYKR